MPPRGPIAPIKGRLGGETVSMEIDFSALMSALKERLDTVGGRTRDVLLQYGREFVHRARRRAPVKTGRFMWSIHMAPMGRPDSYSYTDNHGNRFDGSLSTAADKTELVVGSNVPYASLLESGSSRRQAPNGVFGVTALEIFSEIKAELAKIARRRERAGRSSTV